MMTTLASSTSSGGGAIIIFEYNKIVLYSAGISTTTSGKVVGLANQDIVAYEGFCTFQNVR